ncbi:kynurenine/alpha-aminoadipate aminotransferase, mitochondrial-like [Macrobrachium rosenbergii]|uniref:kynurenine/alpha-aminoadipate aminotransferase, mitochondrial-like n=1 Tax=Macrobrachium rosenbergii TaxID=79674 RepID=UPI0034D71EB1
MTCIEPTPGRTAVAIPGWCVLQVLSIAVECLTVGSSAMCRMDHSHLLSNTMQLYKPSVIAMYSQIAKGFPDPVKLSIGYPNPTMFPFKDMTLTMKDGRDIIIDESLMAECQQYGTAKGHGPLMEQLRTLTKRLHDPPLWQESDLLVLPGSQMGISLVFKMLVNPEDFILVAEPVYYGVVAALQCLRHRVATVKCDSDGMRPDNLKEVLENCRLSSKGKNKVLYLNPSGNNPTGVVWSETRRRLIYEIACRHDLIILEDDPYFLLEFGETLTTSFLRLDTESRVIRLDSFSKTVSAGIRLGYATGPKDLIDKLRLLLMPALTHASLLAQVCVSKWLETVGIDGFLENAKRSAEFYKDKRNLAIKAAEKHLKGLCEWHTPAGGMYLWLKVTDVADTKKLVLIRCPQKGVLAMPGVAFFVDQNRPSQYFRISYSSIDYQKVDEFLYVNPGGSNPDGTVLSESRRRRIYDLACQYDILIVEDDPYYFWQFCDEVPPSFLQLDTEGRVLRLESFSKILGGGLRLGFAIIPNRFAPVLGQMIFRSIMHTSMPPQVMVCRLFDTWGVDGFLKETERAREFYRKQRDTALQAAEKHLKGWCEWTTPLGGFSLWLKVPKLKDTRNLLLECGRERGVVLVPGCGFLVDQSKPSQFMRACYSNANEKELDKAFKILAEAIRDEIKKEEST